MSRESVACVTRNFRCDNRRRNSSWLEMASLAINFRICPCRNFFCMPKRRNPTAPYTPACIIMRSHDFPCQRKSSRIPQASARGSLTTGFQNSMSARSNWPTWILGSTASHGPAHAFETCPVPVYPVSMSDLAAASRAEESPAARTQALLDVAESIAHHRDLGELFHDLSECLHLVAHFDFLILLLHDPARDVMRLHILETLHPAGIEPGLEMPVQETPGGRVFETQQPLIIDDVQADGPFPAVLEILRRESVRSYCTVPLTTAQRKLGAIGFGTRESYHYAAAEVDFMQQVARQVAVAVDNALNFQAAQAYQEQLARERDALRVLLEVNNAVVSTLDLRQLFQAIARSLQRVLHHEFTSLALVEPGTQKLRMLELDFAEGQGLYQEEILAALEDSPPGCAFSNRAPRRFNRAQLEAFDSEVYRLLLAKGIRTACCVPLITRERVLGTLNAASLRDSAFTQQDMDLLSQVATQIAIAVENALSFQEIA